MNTLQPVSNNGWYERADGSWGYYRNLRCVRVHHERPAGYVVDSGRVKIMGVDYAAPEPEALPEPTAVAPESGRGCGQCRACCSEIDVPELSKPAGVSCRHLTSSGCRQHPVKPESCRSFTCTWLAGLGEPRERPDRSGVMVVAAPVVGDDRTVNVLLAVELKPGASRRVLTELLELAPVILVTKTQARVESVGGKFRSVPAGRSLAWVKPSPSSRASWLERFSSADQELVSRVFGVRVSLPCGFRANEKTS